jgi:hypothetical protein
MAAGMSRFNPDATWKKRNEAGAARSSAAALARPCRSPVQAQQASTTAATAESIRKEVEVDKRGLVERYMHLTPEELKKFRPVYEEYQKRLAPIRQKQNRAVLDYIESEDSMTDANAEAHRQGPPRDRRRGTTAAREDAQAGPLDPAREEGGALPADREQAARHQPLRHGRAHAVR